MFEFEYDKIDNILGGDHIRILSLVASETFTDPIHVSLSIVNLRSQPTYEALSYCWGDASDKRLIFCHGKPFPVTQNLEDALRHLRQSEGDRVLWIDAICINQNDLIERAGTRLISCGTYTRPPVGCSSGWAATVLIATWSFPSASG